MCFSNLPVEFDEEGNPYLAEEAEAVERHPQSECGCTGTTDDVALHEADPESMYEAILESMPGDVHEQVADSGRRTDDAVEHERPESTTSD